MRFFEGREQIKATLKEEGSEILKGLQRLGFSGLELARFEL